MALVEPVAEDTKHRIARVDRSLADRDPAQLDRPRQHAANRRRISCVPECPLERRTFRARGLVPGDQPPIQASERTLARQTAPITRRECPLKMTSDPIFYT